MDNVTWFQETTDWAYPNHTYALNEKNQMVAYIRASDGEMVVLKNPSKQFSKSRRKFKRIKL
jgi:hypothetical protein